MDSQKTCKKCILMREALLEINEEIKKYNGSKDSTALCENIKGLIKNALEPIGWYQARLFEDDREDNVYGDCRTQFELARAIFSITYQYGLKTGRQIRGVLKTPDGRVFSLGKLGINVDEWDCYKCMEFSLHINASEFVEETNKKSGANLEPTEKMKGESR